MHFSLAQPIQGQHGGRGNNSNKTTVLTQLANSSAHSWLHQDMRQSDRRDNETKMRCSHMVRQRSLAITHVAQHNEHAM
jgi:hypothetical protein